MNAQPTLPQTTIEIFKRLAKKIGWELRPNIGGNNNPSAALVPIVPTRSRTRQYNTYVFPNIVLACRFISQSAGPGSFEREKALYNQSNEGRGVMSENAPNAPQLKERSELTESDLVAIETADGRLVVAYLVGQHGGFMYIVDELSLNSTDLTNVSSASLVPELIFYSSGMRAVNVQSVRSFFRPSPLLRLLYQETLSRLMDTAKKGS